MVVDAASAGMLMIVALAVGFKVAIYISVAVLAILIDVVAQKNEKKTMHGLNLMAFAFVIVGLLEFFHVLAAASGFLPALASHETIDLLIHPFLMVGGLGIVWFLWGVSKNIKAYR